jgi:hypothetical protein
MGIRRASRPRRGTGGRAQLPRGYGQLELQSLMRLPAADAVRAMWQLLVSRWLGGARQRRAVQSVSLQRVTGRGGRDLLSPAKGSWAVAARIGA